MCQYQALYQVLQLPTYGCRHTACSRLLCRITSQVFKALWVLLVSMCYMRHTLHQSCACTCRPVLISGMDRALQEILLCTVCNTQIQRETFVVLLHKSEQALVAQHELLLRLTRLLAALCHQGDYLHGAVRLPSHADVVCCRSKCVLCKS